MKNRARTAVAFSPKDYEVLEARLRARFPEISFFDTEKSFNWLDYDAMRRRHNEDPDDYRAIMLPRPEWKMQYLDRLLAEDHVIAGAWCEPPGWRLSYAEPDQDGQVYPRPTGLASLSLAMCHFADEARKAHWPDPPERRGPDVPHYLAPMPVQTNHDPDCPAQTAFARGVWSILTGLMTNRLGVYSGETGEFICEAPKGNWLWAGHAACAWTREHPMNFISWGKELYRGLDSAE